MRPRAPLLLLLGAVACSRGPSPQEAYSQAWVAFQQGKLGQAQEVVSKALEKNSSKPVDDGIIRLKLLHAEILLGQRHTAEASKILNGLPESHDLGLHLRWLVDRADLLSKTTRGGEQATALLDEADRQADADVDSKFKALLLRGVLLIRGGNYDLGDDLLIKTAAAAAEAGKLFYQAGAFLDLSFSKLARDRLDESTEYSSRALETARKAQAGQIEALANNNLGTAYSLLHDLDRAEQYEHTAIERLGEIGDLGNLEDAYGELGNIHQLKHQPALAVEDFQKAVEIAKRVDATVEAARWARQLARAYIDQQKWDQAESWNQQAITLYKRPNDLYAKLNEAAIASGRGYRDEAVRLYRELISEPAKTPYLEWNAHLRLGALFANEKRFDDADKEYERGLAVIEQFRANNLVKDDSRLTYYDLQVQFFKDYVDELVSQGHKDRALEIVEYSRARVLAEKLGQPGVIPRVRLDSFKNYARRTGTTLVSYWLGPSRSFAWVIKPTGIRMQELPSESQIEDLIKTYRKQIEQDLRDPVEDRLSQGTRLSEMLLRPIREDLGDAKRVIVIPDGALHALNLETLPAAADPSRYWIEDVEISVAPSLGVLADPVLIEKPKQTQFKPAVLIIGAPESATAEYPELPGAQAEIQGIRGRLGNREQVVHIGRDATPRAFLDSMPEQFSMIHFAAHAESDPRSPLESAVILSKSGESYKLYARDIAGLKLSADLVTISACRSAGARTYGGEGLVGLAWAFLKAGAHTVIAGLWEVDDRSSSDLMDKLYGGVASNMAPAAALRAAKLTLLHSRGSSRKPFYWAPYQVYTQ